MDGVDTFFVGMRWAYKHGMGRLLLQYSIENVNELYGTHHDPWRLVAPHGQDYHGISVGTSWYSSFQALHDTSGQFHGSPMAVLVAYLTMALPWQSLANSHANPRGNTHGRLHSSSVKAVMKLSRPIWAMTLLEDHSP